MGVFRNEKNSTPAKPAVFNEPRALTAAAAQIKINDKGEAEQFRRRRSSAVAMWQSEAWEYYDAIAEIKFAFTLVSSVVSRIRLYAAVVEDVAETPVPIKTAQSIDPMLAAAAERGLARLDSAYGGQAGLLRDAALNLSVSGECYLVQVPARLGSNVKESWDIRSVDELQATQGNAFRIVPRRDLLNGNMSANVPGTIALPQDAFVGRIWRAHPRFSEEPDSSMRGLLDLCSELLLLNRTFRATARSRLNAGALYLPDGLSLAANPDPDYPYPSEGDNDGPTPEESADDFEEQLMDAMITPIKDEDSASAVVPLIIRGPSDLGDKIHQFKFERSFDENLIARGDRVLERILQGLDVPKDMVTGLANVKYSNAQQIDDALYKSHIEPMILLIADAITQVYLRPYLRSIGYAEAEVERVVVWYDPSSVATRSDRAADADSGFEKVAISAETWRRTHGFSDADAPTSTEFVMRMLTTQGTFSPELTEALLTAFAPEVMAAAKGASQAANPAPIPTGVQDVLNGGQGVPGDPAAAADPSAPADPAAAGTTDPAAPTGPNGTPSGTTDENGNVLNDEGQVAGQSPAGGSQPGDPDAALLAGKSNPSAEAAGTTTAEPNATAQVDANGQPIPGTEEINNPEDQTIPPDSENPVPAGQDAPPVVLA